MRASWLITILLLGASCRVQLPSVVKIKSTGKARAAVKVQPAVRVGVEVRTNVKVEATAEARDHEAVPLEEAPVVEFFGVPLEDAADVVFVLDRSGSMDDLAQGQVAEIAAEAGQPAPRKIDVAQAELVAALEKLPAGTRINVLFFDSGLEAWEVGLAPIDETSRPALIRFVKDTFPSGSTALAPAMRTAFLMNPRRVVLLSDGIGNVGGGSDAVLRDAREAMRGGVRIDAIGLGAYQDVSLLRALAEESGGLYQQL